jgi:RNA polymerase sigma factor (sigma-70 family)
MLLAGNERKKYIHLALSKLSGDDRAVITLYYIAGKNIGEICKILGTGKSAVKMRLLRSRAQLEAQLGKLLNEESKQLL